MDGNEARSPRPALLRTIKLLRAAALGKSVRTESRGLPISPVPAQATTVVNEPGFHPSSPAVLQRLVSVIVAMGPHSSFADEVSDCSELTMQLLQRRFQHFSDDWLRRVMCALRNWQVWAAKHSPPFPRWNPSANQLGEYLIDADKRGPTVARGIWTQLDWARREMGGAFPTDSSLLASFRLHAVGHLPTPLTRCHQACSLRSCTIRAKPRARSRCSEGLLCF